MPIQHDLEPMETDERFINIEDLGPQAWLEFAEARGWSDGLPLVPPTVEAVGAFTQSVPGLAAPLPPVPPRNVVPTLDSVAANAVMAGCLPRHLPVVVAALRAATQPAYNLHGTLATTHSCANLILISGPGRRQLGINAAGNCFGQGTRANASIGRALQLVFLNIGGARPGALDRSTLGNPAKYSYCFGENEEASPWAPYRVRQGFAAEDTVVTVLAAEGPHNVNDHNSKCGDELIDQIARTMSQPGSNNICGRGPCFVVICPEHATLLADDGWDVAKIQAALYERSKVPESRTSRGFAEDAVNVVARSGHYYLAPTPADIHVVVAGGAGKHSAYIPSFGITQVMSRRVPGADEPL